MIVRSEIVSKGNTIHTVCNSTVCTVCIHVCIVCYSTKPTLWKGTLWSFYAHVFYNLNMCFSLCIQIISAVVCWHVGFMFYRLHFLLQFRLLLGYLKAYPLWKETKKSNGSRHRKQKDLQMASNLHRTWTPSPSFLHTKR